MAEALAEALKLIDKDGLTDVDSDRVLDRDCSLVTEALPDGVSETVSDTVSDELPDCEKVCGVEYVAVLERLPEADFQVVVDVDSERESDPLVSAEALREVVTALVGEPSLCEVDDE